MRTRHSAMAAMGATALLAAAGGVAAADPPEVHHDAASALELAYRTTLAEKTARIALVENATTGNRTIRIVAHGETALSGPRPDADLTMAVPTVGAFQVIIDGTMVYLKLPPALDRQIPGKKPWLALDLTKLSGALAAEFSQFASSSQASSSTLAYLGAVSTTTDDGASTVGGVATTRYSTAINLARLASLKPTLATGLKQLETELGSTTLPMTVWVDHANRIRRMAFSLSVTPKGSSSTSTGAAASPVRLSMAFDYLAFGVPVNVTPPPASETYDATSAVGGTS